MSRLVVALDIETTGLDAYRDEIHMCGLWDGETYTCVRNDIQLQMLLLNKYANYDIVGHRTDFDLKFLLVKKWILPRDLIGRTAHDTRIIGSLLKQRVPKEFLDNYEVLRKELNKTLPKGSTHREGSPLSLKTMAPWYLKVPMFWETPGDHNNEEYNQLDCVYTYRLFQLLAPRLKDEGSWDFYTNRMLEWTKMVREMEIKGISISMDELGVLEKEYEQERAQLKLKLDEHWAEAHSTHDWNLRSEITERYHQMASAAITKKSRGTGTDGSPILYSLKQDQIDKITKRYEKMQCKAMDRLNAAGGARLNYSSPAQMTWLLRDYLGLNITDPEGEESTGKAVLNRLAAEGREDIRHFLEWRKADKILTMYLPTYRELQVEGIIHPSFNLTGTRTGRTSSSGPNLQQVPPKLYRLFRPRSGYRFVQYDLAGIEAALIALYSGDKTLYGILANGDSIHDHNVHTLLPLFGLSSEDYRISDVASKLPQQRKCVKNMGFAVFYGAGWRRISQVFAAGGFPITDAQATHGLDLLKRKYPEAFSFHKQITEVFESGETVRNMFGRPITMQAHENCYMQGFNTLIQSSASDLNIESCYRATKRTNASPLLLIHDFIMLEAKEAQAEEAAKILTECMTTYRLESEHGPIQLRVEGGVSEIWEK